jgi:hypothetical protein
VDSAVAFIKMEAKNMENQKEQKIRVITMITKEEKEALQFLARDSQRSMSGYIRYMLIREIDTNFE